MDGGCGEAECDEESGEAGRSERWTPVDLWNSCNRPPTASEGPVDVQARKERENGCECEGRHFNRDLGTGA